MKNKEIFLKVAENFGVKPDIKPGPKLKPCPFCGSDDIEIYGNNIKGYAVIHQNTSDCFLWLCCSNEYVYKSKAEAIKAWNTRYDEVKK